MAGVVTLGEALVVLASERVGPLRHARRLQVGIAGSELNVAIGVRRLGVPSAWIGRVATDEWGELIVSTLRGEGVDTSWICRDASRQTAIMFKERRTPDKTRVSYYREESAGSALAPIDLIPEAFHDTDWLHVTGITPALSVSAHESVIRAMEIARSEGMQVSLDLNYRAALWSREHAAATLGEIVPQADIVFASPDEAEILVGPGEPAEQARRIQSLGATDVVVKLGARGAVALVEGRIIDVPAAHASVVDVLGAGDAFVAGYLAQAVLGGSYEKRLSVAATCGAIIVSGVGDWEPAPSLDEVSVLGDISVEGVTR